MVQVGVQVTVEAAAITEAAVQAVAAMSTNSFGGFAVSDKSFAHLAGARTGD